MIIIAWIVLLLIFLVVNYGMGEINHRYDKKDENYD